MRVGMGGGKDGGSDGERLRGRDDVGDWGVGRRCAGGVRRGRRWWRRCGAVDVERGVDRSQRGDEVRVDDLGEGARRG